MRLPGHVFAFLMLATTSGCGGTSVEDTPPAGAAGVGSAASSGGAPGGGGAPGSGAATGVPDAFATCPGAGPNPVAELTQTTGDNGKFVDHCDTEGNLVTYHCGTTSEWECNDFECYGQPYPTATVVEETQDCAGTCQNGRCASKCPRTGDVLQYVGKNPDGSHRIDNKSGGFVYRCETLFDSCLLPDPGQTDTVDYYEAQSKTCMGTVTAAVGFDQVENPNDIPCTFTCSAGAS